MKSLRVPAGVYVNGVAHGGRFVAPSALPGLVSEAEGDGAERLLAVMYDQLDKATRRHERAERKFDDDPKRYAHERAATERERQLWEGLAEQSESVFHEDEEPYAVEWEIGFDYSSAESNSDVDVNIRIRRQDRHDMGQTEAAAALRAFRANLAEGETRPIPRGYQMAAINWRRPQHGGGWRSSQHPLNDLENFNSPMYADHNNEGAWSIGPYGTVRMGSVKK